MTVEPKKTLDRELGLAAILAVSMGAMLGSGIFVLPGVAVSYAGPALPLAYLLSALIVLPAALCKAELATALPRSGGTYLYVERGLGPLAGTVVGLGVWFSLVFKSAFALVGLGAYFVFAFNVAPENQGFLKGLSVAICLGLMFLNMGGIKKSSKLQNVIVGFALLGLTVFVGFCLPEVNVGLVTDAVDVKAYSIFKTAGMVFVSFAGVTKICSIAEEVKDPNKNLPRGILLSLGVIALIYVVVTSVLVGVVPIVPTLGGNGFTAVFAKSNTPLADVAREVLGHGPSIAIAVLATATLTSMANSGMMTSSRFPLAMARDKLLPSFLSRINQRYRTPVWAILLTGLLMASLVLFVDVINLAKLASAFKLLVFACVNLSIIVIRESGARWYKPRFTVPGYPFVPIAGFVGCLVLLGFMGPVAYVGAGGIVGFGLLWYFVYARKRVTRSGAVTRLYGEARRSQNRSGRLSGAFARSSATGGVVIPIFERDEDIEDLIPLGAMLADRGADLKVLRIEEVPDQSTLAMFGETDALTRDIAANVETLAKTHGIKCQFEDVVTHNAKRVLFDRVVERGAHWIVMRWQQRSPWRRFVPDPVAWFIHHPPSDLILFRESPGLDGAGLHRFKRLLVLAEPGPNDALVVHVADRFAASHKGVTLTFLLSVPSDAPPDAEEHELAYHASLAKMCTSATEAVVVRSDDDVQVVLSMAADYDLLVLGAPPENAGVFRGTFEDRVTEGASCAVLRVKAVRGSAHAAVNRSAYPQSADRSDRLRLRADPKFRIGDLISHVQVIAGDAIATKEDLFKAIAEGFTNRCKETLSVSVEEALWEREHKQVTALGEGVAVPHVTLDELDATYVEVWVLEHGIDFKGADPELVDVIFAVFAPPGERRIHLRTLARIGQLVLESDFLTLMRVRKNSNDIRVVITDQERQLD